MPDGAPPPLRVLDRRGAVEIFAHGDIEPGMAEAYARELKVAGNRPVLVRLHSPGGDWLEASAMYAATQAHPGRTVALVEGLAASSASFLLQAFSERRIARNALVMVHAPHMTASGRAEDHEVAASVLKTVRTRLASAYARSGQPTAVIDGWLAREVWFDAEEALAAGLVDAIDQPARVAAHFDLSRFSNVPPAVLAVLKGRRPPAQTSDREATMDAITERPEDIAPASSPFVTDTGPAIRAAYRSAAQLGLANSDVDQLLDGGIAPDALPQSLIDLHVARQARVSGVQRILPSGGRMAQAHDEQMIVEALANRLSGKGDGGNPWAHRSLLDIARSRLEARGVVTASLTKEEIFFPRAGIRNEVAGHTTSDFPNLLGNAVNKALLDLYQAVESPLKTVSRRNDVGNFLPRSVINLGVFPELKKVLEAGEITHGTIDEKAESWSLASYGRIFGVSFQALTNDSLGGLGDWTRAAAFAAAQAEGDVLFALLSANSYTGVTLSDSVALFNSAHGNLAGSGGAFSVTTLGAAVSAMRQQKALGATVPLGIAPKYVICGPATELVVRQALSSAVVPNAASAANPWRDVVEVLVEPRLAARTDWYVFASPALWPVLEHGYLSGFAGPQVATQEGFEVLAIQMRLVLHFGGGVVDYRGAYRNAGA